MAELKKVMERLASYNDRPLRIMEVCGTHTAEITRSGLPELLSNRIRLISGPGCPVCVTVTSYIDRLIALSFEENVTVVSFGDLLRVPGSSQSLSEAKAAGGRVEMVYSPLQVLKLARENPERLYLFAAVGFETTTPVYAQLILQAQEDGIENIRLLTSLKTMPGALRWICRHENKIDGFLAPGHVCVVTGTAQYEELAAEFGVPFVVSGFRTEELLAAVYALVCLQGKGVCRNFYPSAVRTDGNPAARERVLSVFEACDAAWRGIGRIPGSGMRIRKEFRDFDAGSDGLYEDQGKNSACQCARVLLGEISPRECPLFAGPCTPLTPQGACMVSMEGSCYHSYQSR